MPFINSGVRAADEKQLITGVVILILILSFGGVFFEQDVFDLDHGYSFVWIAIMYLLGAVLKRFGAAEKLRPRVWLLLYAAATVLIWLTSMYLRFMINKGFIAGISSLTFLSYLSPFTVIQAICLVMGFAGIKTGSRLNRVIAFAAHHAFSVYIIHANEFIWDYIMKTAFTWISGLSFPLRPLSVIGCAAAVFIVCVLIDIPRAWLFSAVSKLIGRFGRKKEVPADKASG